MAYILEKTNILAKRILSNQEFFDGFKKILQSYTDKDQNLVDDLNFYDDMYDQMRPEFYNDQAKLFNDFMFDDAIAEYRVWLVDNFAQAKEIATIEQTPFIFEAPQDNGELQLAGSFKDFNDIFLNIDQFLAKHPQFIKYNQDTIWLTGGSHVFRQAVIIPQGLKLEIRPGTRLFFDEGVSLLSYSPVEAKGTEYWPIIMQSLVAERPWGSFAVLNVDQENTFEHVQVSGGSSDLINGVLLTAQFSLHNTKSIVNNCIFEDSKSDDAFHAILGSVDIRDSIFRNNYADAIDVDYVHDSSIKNSFFDNDKSHDQNGDAIDVSGVDNFIIQNNDIRNYGDKCISIGEVAKLEVKDNIISGCNIGVAVKDDSQALLDNNIIIANQESGLALYRKKQEFIKGGQATLQDSILWGNQEQISQDNLSELEIVDSFVEGQHSQPDFEVILPNDLYMLYKDRL